MHSFIHLARSATMMASAYWGPVIALVIAIGLAGVAIILISASRPRA
ncbi:MAG: hypothetical protein M1368_00475 [Thaumarchaeota archaeon]|nr:hypothetical protein [Nitrososphaerota archaeon]